MHRYRRRVHLLGRHGLLWRRLPWHRLLRLLRVVEEGRSRLLLRLLLKCVTEGRRAQRLLVLRLLVLRLHCMMHRLLMLLLLLLDRWTRRVAHLLGALVGVSL
jgi:hypothetical protein